MPVLGLVVLVLVAGGALWFTLGWLGRVAAVPVDQSKAIYGKDYVTSILDAVKIALSVVAGGAGLFAIYLAVRRQRTAEGELRARLAAQAHTEDDARAGRVTDLYTKAAELLGSDKAPVRLAGLYALERLGEDNPGQRSTIAGLWCAYLRMPYTLPEMISPAGSPHTEAVLERDVRLSVQSLLIKHLECQYDGTGPPTGNFWPEILEVDLTEATLIGLDMARCRLPHLRMRRATFVGNVSFHRAAFEGDAVFADASFLGNAWFYNALFTGSADFDRAMFFGDAEFSRLTVRWKQTIGRGTTFVDARFAGDARFEDARFTGSVLFGGAEFQTVARCHGAMAKGHGMWGYSWPKGWVLLDVTAKVDGVLGVDNLDDDLDVTMSHGPWRLVVPTPSTLD